MFDGGELFSHRFQKSILIILFLFLTIALFITWNTPSTGFESSIFNSMPLVLWIALILSIIVGITITIMSFSKSNFGRSNIWKYGFFLIFFCYVIGGGLFIIRGYYLWDISGDPSTHIGWIKEILQNGFIPIQVFYPVAHILVAEICLLTTMNPISFLNILPFFFGLLAIVFMYLFVRVISSNQIEPLIAVIICCCFGLDVPPAFTPNLLANLFLPLVLFLMFKYLTCCNKGWKILFFIMLILLPIFHPIPAIFLGLILLTLWIPLKLKDFWMIYSENNHDLSILNRMNVKLVIPFLILFIWFLFWYSLFSLWGYSIIQVYNKIVIQGESSHLSDLTNTVSYAQGYGYNVFEILLKQYGIIFFFFVLSIFAFFLLWKIVSRDRKLEKIFSLYGPWSILLIIMPVFYLFNLGFSPLRILFYQGILGIVFSAFLLSYILHWSREKKKHSILLANMIIIVILVSLFLIGFLNLYPSPYNLNINFQTTHSEVSGITFFYEYRNVTIPVSGLGIAVGRFADLLLTPEKKSEQNLPTYLRQEDFPPWHFGYNQFSSISSSYDNKTNLIITQRDRVLYTEIYPTMAKFRFVPHDFERLKYDYGANLIYSNGGFDILTIEPKG